MARKWPLFFAGIQSFLNRIHNIYIEAIRKPYVEAIRESPLQGIPRRRLLFLLKPPLAKEGLGGFDRRRLLFLLKPPLAKGGLGGFPGFPRRPLLFIVCLLLGCLFALSLPGRSLPPPDLAPEPSQLMLQGKEFYDRGEFDRAAEFWENAAIAYESQGNAEKMLENRINQSLALQAIGFYPQACLGLVQGLGFEWLDCNSLSENNSPRLEEIKSNISALENDLDSVSLTEAIAWRSLGKLLQRMGSFDTAEKLLRLSLQVTRDSNSPQQESAGMLSLANNLRAIANQERNRLEYDEISKAIKKGSTEEILKPYEEVFELYEESAQISSASLLTQIQAQLNQLSLLWELNDWWQNQVKERDENWPEFQSELVGRMEQLWPKILSDFDALPPTRSGLYARINLAQTLINIKQSVYKGDRGGIAPTSSLSWPEIEEFLTVTKEQAERIQDSRSQAYALGYLGRVAEGRSQLKKAIHFTEQALLVYPEPANDFNMKEVEYLWQSQLGRLQKEGGNIKQAISMYDAAVDTLKSLREDLVANNREIQLDFRQEVEPVYQTLAGLFLKREGTDDIESARQTIESLQIAELDNFFQDPCSQEVSDPGKTDESDPPKAPNNPVPIEKINKIDPKAAIIYPLVLPDRLELILSLPGKRLDHYEIPVSEKEVKKAIETIYDRLYNKRPSLVNSSAYWFFTGLTNPPLPEDLKPNIETLLDNLQQAYKWFIAPLEEQLASKEIETLVFVLNGSLQRLPMSALYDGEHYLIEKYGVVLAPSLQLLDPNPIEPKNIKVLAAGLSEERNVKGQLFISLPGVKTELDLIQEIFPKSEKFLNGEFKEDRLIEKIGSSDFPIVHLATHGVFSSQSENTFILTGDKGDEDEDYIIDINELEQVLNPKNSVRKKAIDLLVLSACETATGDDRAVLGLAGVALRSGARSTLAGLWPVGDETTPKLMKDFYKGLKAGQTKVQALRNAQINLINDLKERPNPNYGNLPPGYETLHRQHPYFWAPYVLVGNWQ